MEITIQPISHFEQLKWLPTFAHFLRESCLHDFIEAQLQQAKLLNLSLLENLKGMPEENRKQFFVEITLEFLTHLAEGRPEELITFSLLRWKENRLPEIEKNEVGRADITQMTYLRKQAMMQFAPRFCTDTTQLLQLAQEIDFFSMKWDDASFSTYFELLQRKIEDQSYLTSKITNTSPGFIYLLSLKPYSILFANQTATSFFGVTSSELTKMGTAVFERLIHPDDLPATFHFLREISGARDSEVHTLEFRMKPSTGDYVWMRNYFSVFRRDAEGMPLEIIGNILNIQAEKEALARLRESEFRYKQAEAITHLGNWSIDLKTEYIRWSDEMYRIYELNGTEPLTLEQWHNLVHPADRESVIAHYEECIARKTAYNKIHRIVMPDGREKVLHRRAEITFDNNGQAIRMLGTTQDITEQHRVQQELRENQTFLRKITDAAPSIIATNHVTTGRYTFLSKGMEKLLGYKPETVINGGLDFLLEKIHPADLPEVLQKMRESLAEANAHPDRNDLVVELFYRIKHNDGEYRWFNTYSTVFDRNIQGEVEHILNISLDVTDQKKASQKIEEQEQFIQNIADASPTILYVYDVAGGHFQYVNREIYFVLGYTPEEVLEMGNAVTDRLYHPEDFSLLPERKQSNRQIKESDVMIQYECRLRHKSGEWLWFLVREVVFRTDDADRPLEIVGAALDISKRKEMEKTLLQNSFMLEQSNASLEEFAYVASHDLKEPLRKISTFGDRLAATQAEKLSPEGKLFLSKIIDASQRMQTMISDLLSISMISGNKDYEPYSLQKLLDETLLTLEYKIEQKNAKVVSDGLPQANVIVSQFRQLFQNLISNSLKFVAEDVQPQVTISHTYIPPESVTMYQLTPAPRYLKIEFKDNGIGFEKEQAGKIFLLFQRLHGRSEYEGSGIGLSICKKIVEHHGGVIYAQGEPEAGATFTIILPVTEDRVEA